MVVQVEKKRRYILGTSKYVELNGKLVSRKEYCRKTGYSYTSICYYVEHYNLTWDEAIAKYLEFKNKRRVRDWRFRAIWQGMLSRCTSQNCPSYNRYGGKKLNPVTLCDRWYNYFNFEDDMYESYVRHVEEYGKKNTTLDRIDSSANYTKENCRWATLKEQANNKSNNRKVTKDLTMAQFSEKYNIPYETLRRRLELGWSVEDIINTPVKSHKKKYKKIIAPTGETIEELSKRIGIKKRTIYARFCNGWTWDDIINTPLCKNTVEKG